MILVYHRRILAVLLILEGSLVVQDIAAQNIRLSLHDVALTDAILEFEAVTGASVAFSDALVDDVFISCEIETESREEALTCLLLGTNISFRFTPPLQFVLIPPQNISTSDKKTATVYGFISDLESGASLFGAHVTLDLKKSGTTTNEAGFFTLPGIPTGFVRLRVSFIGYSSIDTTIVVPGPQADIQLPPTTMRIGDLVVEDRPYTSSESLSPPGAVSLSVRQLEQLPNALGGKDVLTSLGLLSGIRRTGEATGGLVVRGSGPDQILYLVDGAPVYHPWHAFSVVSTFQTDIFKDVKFYRGSFPAEYGGRLSSVMTAELRDGAGPKPRAAVSINALNARFFVESPLGKSSSFMVSGRRSYIDQLVGRRHPVQDASGRRDTLRTGYYFYDWSAKISISPTRNSDLSFTYYTGRDVLDLRLPFDISLDFSSWLRPADLFFEVDQSWGNDLYSLRYRFLLSNRVFVTSTLYHTRYRAREAALVQPTSESSVNSAYSVNLKDTGLRIQADYQASLDHQLRGGIQVVDHQFDSAVDALVTYGPNLNEILSQHGDISSAEYSAFIQDRWTPSTAIFVNGGIRASYFGTGNHFRLSPRLNFQWNADPKWAIVRGAVSRHVQYLQRIRDRYSFLYDLVSARWIPSDSTVNPATATHLSVGVESNPQRWLKITVDLFHRESKNVILPRDEFQSKNGLLGPGIETGTLLGQHTAGIERTSGIESSVMFFRNGWNLLLTYTGSISKNRTPLLKDDSFRPSRFDVPRAMTIVAQKSSNRWQYSLTMNWRSGYPLTVPISRYSLEDPISGEITHYFHRPQINNGRLPPYFRLDARLGYRFTFLRAAWSADVLIYNILGRRNVLDRSFDPSLDGFRWQNQRGIPRVPLFELEMRL